MEMYQIILLTVAAIIAVLYIVQRFSGVSYIEKIIQWKPVQAAITALVKAVAGILPSNYFKTVITVLEAAGEGAQTAEDLWKMGQLPKEERNSYAKAVTAEVLTKAGIEVTEQIQLIIDGAIEMVCMLMPHGVTPYKESEDETPC